MSYAISAALQEAVYQTLAADISLSAMVGGAIYDALPSGTAPDLYISLGPETARDASDKTGYGAVHLFTVSVISDAPGFAKAKAVAASICDALVDTPMALTRGRCVSLQFDQARAARTENSNSRQIDLRFRARVEDS